MANPTSRVLELLNRTIMAKVRNNSVEEMHKRAISSNKKFLNAIRYIYHPEHFFSQQTRCLTDYV